MIGKTIKFDDDNQIGVILDKIFCLDITSTSSVSVTCYIVNTDKNKIIIIRPNQIKEIIKDPLYHIRNKNEIQWGMSFRITDLNTKKCKFICFDENDNIISEQTNHVNWSKQNV